LKKKYAVLIAVLLGWGILLWLLLTVESGTDSDIRTISDAVWFSLVTLTTVGYGDLYPVTAAGRMISAVFILFSTGVLTMLIALGVSILTGNMLPAIRLWILGRRQWYVFSAYNEVSEALARELSLQEPKAVFVFGGGGNIPHGISLPEKFPLEEALSLKGDRKNTALFFIGENGLENLRKGLSFAGKELRIYCRTEFSCEKLPQNVVCFHDADNCARLFWQKYALEPEERTVCLIGGGRYGEKLLERALLTNVFERDRQVAYHVFGDYADFRRNHFTLEAILQSGDHAVGNDLLYFHESWNFDPALLARADRIILCGESEEAAFEQLSLLRTFFAVSGKIFIRSSRAAAGAQAFGMAEELFTVELVMRTLLDRAAMEMNEAYRRSAENAPSWRELTEFLRQSNIAASDHLLTKVRMLLPGRDVHALTGEICEEAYQVYAMSREARAEEYREIEHRRWMRFYQMNNWSYAPKRDNAGRKHPLMVPYESLSPEDQAKDDYAWELIGILGKVLFEKEEEPIC